MSRMHSLLALALLGTSFHSQLFAEVERTETTEGARIAWYTTWQEGLAEAKRTNRPIMLHSAAPQCSGVPGMW